MRPDHARRLEALDAFVLSFERQGRTRRQFWEQFHSLAAGLGDEAFADVADPELRERYCEILANADDAGFTCPDDRLDEVME